MQAFSERLSEDDRKLFSNGAQNLFHVAGSGPPSNSGFERKGMNPSGLKEMARVEELDVAGTSGNPVSTQPRTSSCLRPQASRRARRRQPGAATSSSWGTTIPGASSRPSSLAAAA